MSKQIIQEALDRCEALYKTAKDEPTMFSLIIGMANLKMQLDQCPITMEEEKKELK